MSDVQAYVLAGLITFIVFGLFVAFIFLSDEAKNKKDGEEDGCSTINK